MDRLTDRTGGRHVETDRQDVFLFYPLLSMTPSCHKYPLCRHSTTLSALFPSPYVAPCLFLSHPLSLSLSLALSLSLSLSLAISLFICVSWPLAPLPHYWLHPTFVCSSRLSKNSIFYNSCVCVCVGVDVCDFFFSPGPYLPIVLSPRDKCGQNADNSVQLFQYWSRMLQPWSSKRGCYVFLWGNDALLV